jgi:hypothetical protein
VPEGNWDWADLRDSTVVPVEVADIADLAAAGGVAVPQLTKALETDDRPSDPKFPAVWQSHPNVMFNTGDPKPEPFRWGIPKWTEQTYNEALAKFLGDLACSSDAPEAQTRGLATRASVVSANEHAALWPELFAARVLGPDCPPAKGLSDYQREQLEEIAAKSVPTKAPEATAPGPR